MTFEWGNSGAGRASGHDVIQEGDGEPAGAPSLDTIFSVLAHPHRRYALDCLREHHELTLADLADEVAVREHEQQLNEIPAETVKQVYLSLYHNHIPKLEAAKLVEYEQAQDLVTVSQAIERVDPFLALVDDERLRAM